MNRIGGGIFVGVPARAGERVVWKVFAGRKQGRLARGGRLQVTTERLVFTPHRFDAALGGHARAIELRDIASVTKAKRTFPGDFHSGGLRDRLCVTLHNEESELFVVNHLDAVVEKIQQAANESG